MEYRFVFRTSYQVSGTVKFMSHVIYSDNYMDAMITWNKIPEIQNLSMDQVLDVNIKKD